MQCNYTLADICIHQANHDGTHKDEPADRSTCWWISTPWIAGLVIEVGEFLQTFRCSILLCDIFHKSCAHFIFYYSCQQKMYQQQTLQHLHALQLTNYKNSGSWPLEGRCIPKVYTVLYFTSTSFWRRVRAVRRSIVFDLIKSNRGSATCERCRIKPNQQEYKSRIDIQFKSQQSFFHNPKTQANQIKSRTSQIYYKSNKIGMGFVHIPALQFFSKICFYHYFD